MLLTTDKQLTTRETTKEWDQNRERLICFDNGMFHSVELFPQYKKKFLDINIELKIK